MITSGISAASAARTAAVLLSILILIHILVPFSPQDGRAAAEALSDRSQNQAEEKEREEGTDEKSIRPFAFPALIAVERLLGQMRAAQLTEGDYHFLFHDLQSGVQIRFKDRRVIHPASAIKVPITLCAYERAAGGLLDLDERVTYEDGDYQAGTGLIQFLPGVEPAGTEASQPEEAPAGDGEPDAEDVDTESPGETTGTDPEPVLDFSLKRLVQLALAESDNIALNMLTRSLGLETVRECMENWGGKTPYHPDRKRMTAADMHHYLLAAVRFRSKETALGREFFSFFFESPYRDRIIAGLPAHLSAVNKIGILEDHYHDAAVVFSDKGQPLFILVIFSRGIPHEKMRQTMIEFGRTTYEFHRLLAVFSSL